jgi:Uma2 family endonuclease
MAAPPVIARATETGPSPLPPLENGDRLSRDEFERRYDAMPNLKKAELIDGEVYVASPVRFEQHGEPHAQLVTWMGTYALHTPGVRVGDNSTFRIDEGNEPQPDGTMIIDPAHGGRTRIDADGYLQVGADLVAEVTASSVSIDLHRKFRVYEQNQVQEYLVWRMLDRAVDWLARRPTGYERLPLTAGGYYASEVFPGLRLDPAALVRGDLVRVHQVLHEGLASPEHAEFVARLKQAASP